MMWSPTEKRARNSAVRAIALTGCALLLAACNPDLDVDNPNAPNRQAVTANAGDVVSLVVASFSAYHDVAHSDLGGAIGRCGGTSWTAVFNTMADHSTSNWANYGMAAVGGEPREALPNSTASPNSCLWATPWFRAYQGLAAASTGLKAIEAGTVEPDNPARVQAWAKFNQGLLHGMVSLLFDKGFIVDESVQLQDESGQAIIPEFATYQEINQAAIGYLQEAIEIANNNEFTIPAGWTNFRDMTSSELAALAHSNIARYMARWPRSPSEAESVDWAAVQSHLEQGHTFRFGQPASQGFWSGLEVWSEWGGAALQLAFVDNKTVGPADQSGAYQAWLDAPINESTPFDVETPDERIPEPVDSNLGCWNATFTGAVPDEPRCGMPPSYIGYTINTFMPAARGVIGLSHYSRYETYFGPCSMGQPDFSSDGFVCDFTQFDKDFLMAEALYRQGMGGQAADILNEYREGAGVGEVTADGVSGANCVPRMPNGDCADFMHTLAYEKGLAVSAEHTGDMWADKRRWGMLTSGTAVQVPIPADELQTLQEEIYTFGGSAGSAAPSVQGDEDAHIMAMVEAQLRALEAQREARRSARPSFNVSPGGGSPGETSPPPIVQ